MERKERKATAFHTRRELERLLAKGRYLWWMIIYSTCFFTVFIGRLCMLRHFYGMILLLLVLLAVIVQFSLLMAKACAHAIFDIRDMTNEQLEARMHGAKNRDFVRWMVDLELYVICGKTLDEDQTSRYKLESELKEYPCRYYHKKTD